MRFLTMLLVSLSLGMGVVQGQKDEGKDGKAKAAPSEKADGDKSAKQKATDFMRLVEVGRRAQLQTSVIRYVRPPAKGEKGKTTVDLIGAIHIGDEKYYDKLNKRFEEYDVLLYELVMPAEEVSDFDKAQMKQIHGMQKSMKTVLGLEFQMEGIDYTPKNFVHADMNMKEFLDSQRDQGESFLKLYMDAMGAERKKIAKGETPAGPSAAELAGLIFSPNRSMSLKIMMSRQLADMSDEMERMDGSVIISGRNVKALEVFDTQVDKGKKHIGIFYGAGHMPDFEKRLSNRGFKRKSVEWMSAWNMYVP